MKNILSFLMITFFTDLIMDITFLVLSSPFFLSGIKCIINWLMSSKNSIQVNYFLLMTLLINSLMNSTELRGELYILLPVLVFLYLLFSQYQVLGKIKKLNYYINRTLCTDYGKAIEMELLAER